MVAGVFRGCWSAAYFADWRLAHRVIAIPAGSQVEPPPLISGWWQIEWDICVELFRYWRQLTGSFHAGEVGALLGKIGEYLVIQRQKLGFLKQGV